MYKIMIVEDDYALTKALQKRFQAGTMRCNV